MSKAIAVLVALVAACSPFGGGATFTCATDNDCSSAGTVGRCESSTGFCAFGDGVCPSGLRYGDLAGGLSGSCVSGGTPGDAALPADAKPDTPPGLSCYGTGFVSACFMTPPSGSMMIAGAIDTDNSPTCSIDVVNSTAWCVVAAADLQLADLTATGSRPLVLLATGTIDVTGTVDVASHRLAAPVHPGQIGPGAVPGANTTLCAPGSPPGSSGGGAGGSFVSIGGAGGAPHAGIEGGMNTVAALRGGCTGQNGQSGNPGTGGPGGGAIYLLAGTSISIEGTIDASGAAGTGGTGGNGGGGGGGAGGMIALDAPAITSTGTLYANGGGGAEGASNATPGNDGNEPTGIAPAAETTSASAGGDGGAGAAEGSPAVDGSSGTSGGGGGGGGGVGVIKLFQVTAVGGMASPHPTH